MIASARLPAALGICAIALAACGSSSKPSSSSGSVYAETLNFAQCMRSNGVTNYPDPSSTGRPQSINQVTSNSPAFETASKACQKDAPSGQAGPPAPTAAELRAARAFAQCMRAHRFSQFPDPLTTYGPGFTLGRGEYFPMISGVQSPAFKQAAKACGVQLP